MHAELRMIDASPTCKEDACCALGRKLRAWAEEQVLRADVLILRVAGICTKETGIDREGGYCGSSRGLSPGQGARMLNDQKLREAIETRRRQGRGILACCDQVRD